MNRRHAHKVPSNAHRTRAGTYEVRDYMKPDPGYDPRPLDTHELRDPWLWLGAVVMLLAVAAFCVLVFTIVPAPR